jgi:hypothetical protein
MVEKVLEKVTINDDFGVCGPYLEIFRIIFEIRKFSPHFKPCSYKFRKLPKNFHLKSFLY